MEQRSLFGLSEHLEDVAAADLFQSYEARIAALERLVGKHAAALSVECMPGTACAISMDGDRSGSSNRTNRRMTGPGGSVSYGVYRDSTRSQPWEIGTAVLSGTGTGLPVSVWTAP